MSESEHQTLSVYALKGQARALVAQSRVTGGGLSHALALETVAKKHGYADWNAAKAASASIPAVGGANGTRRGDFEELEIPDLLEWVQHHDRVGSAIQGIVRLAGELETIADSARDGTHAKFLTLVRGKRPYLFECNPSRWDDDRYYLVDRSYTEIDGFAFDEAELDSLGFREWGNSEYCAGIGRDAYPVMDDRFMAVADRTGLKQLARLLVPLAMLAYERRKDVPPTPDDLARILGDDKA